MKKKICLSIAVGVALMLCSCSTAGSKNSSSSSMEAGNTAITMATAFKLEDGTVLSNQTIRFSDKENSADYRLDENGEMTISGLPREGDLALTVLDLQEQPQGEMTLSFSQGSVIDVATGENNIGHITLKADTEELALDFTLYNDGSIQCALQLTQSRIA